MAGMTVGHCRGHEVAHENPERSEREKAERVSPSEQDKSHAEEVRDLRMEWETARSGRVGTFARGARAVSAARKNLLGHPIVFDVVGLVEKG